MGKHKDKLLMEAEKLALSLMYEVSGGSIGKQTVPLNGNKVEMEFSDKRGLLDSVTKLLSARHKITPEDDDDESGDFNKMKEQLHGGGKTKSRNGAGDSLTNTPF